MKKYSAKKVINKEKAHELIAKFDTTKEAIDVKMLNPDITNVVEEPIAEFCAFTLLGST